jgi:MSHA biogenesis protein MshI
MAWFSRKGRNKKRLAFCVAEAGLSVVCSQETEILFFDHIPLDTTSAEAFLSALKKLVNRHRLTNRQCSLVLDYADYQLLMADAPSVPEIEMSKAIKWKVKGLLDYPVEDAVIDTFIVPPHGNAGQRKKVFVAAASNQFLKARAAVFEQALLKLDLVDIALLGERNVLSLYSENKGTEMLLSYQDNFSYITVYHNGDIYLVRKIESVGITDESAGDEVNEVVLLELQRSIDYCISELKLKEPSSIFLTPHFLLKSNFIDLLSSHLSQEVACIDLNKGMKIKREMTPFEQKQCWYALGGTITPALPENGETHAKS